MELFKSEWSNFEKKDDLIIINISGTIGGGWFDEEDENNVDTKQKMVAELKAISEIKGKKIKVIINSFGGSVDHGLAILDMLSTHEASIETEIRGLTASIATVIGQAASTGERVMSDNALYLIHNASTISWGNKNIMKETLDDLEKIDGLIANVYAKRSGKEAQTFIDLMNENNGRGKWLSADEALELGLIDKIVEGVEYQANAEAFKNFDYPEFKDLLPKVDKNENSLINRFENLLNKMKDIIKPKEEKVVVVEDKTDEQLTEDLLKTFEGRVEDLRKKITDLTEERDNLQTKYDSLKAGKTIVKKAGDPSIETNEKSDNILNQMPVHLKAEFKLRRKEN